MVASVEWPASNIAGYIVAGRILGGGAVTSAKIAAMGGPAVVGGLASVGIGGLAAGLTYGIFKLLEARRGKG